MRAPLKENFFQEGKKNESGIFWYEDDRFLNEAVIVMMIIVECTKHHDPISSQFSILCSLHEIAIESSKDTDTHKMCNTIIMHA